MDTDRRAVSSEAGALQAQQFERMQLVAQLRAAVLNVRRGNLEALMARVRARNIEHLVHFTPLPNVVSILEHGLIPRGHLRARELGLARLHTDRRRLDGLPEANCLSITTPNCMMLAAKRQELGGAWAVLGFRPEAVLSKAALFADTNAAGQGGLCLNEEFIRRRASVTDFEWLFEGHQRHRKDMGLAPCHPTRVQAEVLVLDLIEPEALSFVALQDCVPAAVREQVQALLPKHAGLVAQESDLQRSLFEQRADVMQLREIRRTLRGY